MTNSILILALCAASVVAFAPTHPIRSPHCPHRSLPTPLQSSPEPSNEAGGDDALAKPASEGDVARAELLTPEEEEKVGNLVADEEWVGLSMELAEVVRTAVVQDLKRNSREFLGKDEYAVGDFSKEIDKRVKDEVAKMRQKDDYELGDLSVIMDEKVKEMVCELSGNDEYEFGDLSLEIDKRMKESVAEFCGKDSYQFGDLSKEMSKRTTEGVANFTGKSDYQFGDITKTAFKNYTGKDEYEFGDVTKKLMGNLFSGKKKKQ